MGVRLFRDEGLSDEITQENSKIFENVISGFFEEGSFEQKKIYIKQENIKNLHMRIDSQTDSGITVTLKDVKYPRYGTIDPEGLTTAAGFGKSEWASFPTNINYNHPEKKPPFTVGEFVYIKSDTKGGLLRIETSSEAYLSGVTSQVCFDENEEVEICPLLKLTEDFFILSRDIDPLSLENTQGLVNITLYFYYDELPT